MLGFMEMLPVPARDPRPKLAAYIVFVAGAMFAIPSSVAMAAVLVYAVLLHFAAGLPGRELLADARRLWGFVLVVVLVNGVVTPGDALLTVDSRELVTREGIAAGTFFSLRLLVLYAATTLLVRTSSPEELAAALHAAVRPLSRRLADRLAFHAFMTLGFVPLFSDEMERVRVAQSFRGGTLSGGLGDRVRGARMLVVPLLVSALHRSSQLAMVTELRGLQHRLGDVFTVGSPTLRDLLLPVVTAAVVVAAAAGLE